MSNPTALSYLAGRIGILEEATTSLFSFKGQIALVADLPSVDNSAGDAYIVQEDDSFQVWNGSTWVSGGSIRGTNGTNGENGATGATGVSISTVSYATETGDLTITLSNTTEYVFNVKGADGADGDNGLPGVDGNGIATAVYGEETGELVLTMTNSDTYTFNVKGADGKDADVILRVAGDSLVADAITDAWDDHIGVLAEVAANTDLVLPTNGGVTVRVDGKMLRFFCNAASNDSHHYSVKEDGGSTLFTIHGQEAYTMIWRNTTSDWLVVPGIINPKTKPLPPV